MTWLLNYITATYLWERFTTFVNIVRIINLSSRIMSLCELRESRRKSAIESPDLLTLILYAWGNEGSLRKETN